MEVAERLPFIEKAVEWVQSKGYNDIKAKTDDFEDPKGFTQSSTESIVAPDITAVFMGRKHYFDVSLKSDNKRQLVNKWKLLSHLASAKQGKLYLFAPHGHKAFTKRVVEENQLSAEILSL